MIIDQQLVCYKRLPNWTATTLPEMMTQKHNTKNNLYKEENPKQIINAHLFFY